MSVGNLPFCMSVLLLLCTLLTSEWFADILELHLSNICREQVIWFLNHSNSQHFPQATVSSLPIDLALNGEKVWVLQCKSTFPEL